MANPNGSSRTTELLPKYFESKNVKIYPCTYRGYYQDSNGDGIEDLTTVFDPESRLISEYNFTHLHGIVAGKKSYVVSKTDSLLCCVIGGYYFELNLTPAAAGDTDYFSWSAENLLSFLDNEYVPNVSLTIHTRKVDFETAGDTDAKRYLTYLSSVYAGETGESDTDLDFLDTDTITRNNPKYYNTAIAVTFDQAAANSKDSTESIVLDLKKDGELCYTNFLRNLAIAYCNNSDLAVDEILANLELGRETFARSADGGAVAIGTATNAYGQGSIALGIQAQAAEAQVVSQASGVEQVVYSEISDAIAIGNQAIASADASIALGGRGDDANSNGSKASAKAAIAIGSEALADQESAIAFGAQASAKSTRSIAIGSNAFASPIQNIEAGASPVAIGSDANAQDALTVAIGDTAKASKQESVAVGSQAEAQLESSTALGAKAIANKESVAVGAEAVSDGSYTTAVGKAATASAKNTIALGYSANAAAESALAIGAGAETGASGAITIGLNSSASSEAQGAISIGQNAQGSAEGAISIGSGTQSSAQGAITIGLSSTASNEAQGAISVGSDTQSSATGAISIGQNAKSSAQGAISIGSHTQSNSDGSISIGQDSKVEQNASGAIVLGKKANATGLNSIVLGKDAKATGPNSVVLGPGSTAGERNIIIGVNNTPKATAEILIGNGLNPAGSESACVIGNYNESDKRGQFIIATGMGDKKRKTSATFGADVGATIYENLKVSGNSHIAGTATIDQATELKQDLTVSGETKLNNKLTTSCTDAKTSSELIVDDRRLNFSVTAQKSENFKQGMLKLSPASASLELCTKETEEATENLIDSRINISNNSESAGIEIAAKDISLQATNKISIQAKEISLVEENNMSLYQFVFNMAHPIDSIFMTVKLATVTDVENYFNNTFGVTSEWEVWGDGRVPMGTSESGANDKGGNDTVTLESKHLPSHSHNLTFAVNNDSADSLAVDGTAKAETLTHTPTCETAGAHYHQIKGWGDSYDEATYGGDHKGKAGRWSSAHDGSDNTFRSAEAGYTCHGWSIAWNKLWTNKEYGTEGHIHTVSVADHKDHTHELSASLATKSLVNELNTLTKTFEDPNKVAESFDITPKYQKCYMYRRTK